MAVTFNGLTKQIAVTGYADYAVVDVEKELYSAWKRWAVLADNAKYLQAFRPIGGDATGGTQSAPPYFFLMNDWKVLNDGIVGLGFNTNLYCEEASNANTNPFLVINNGSVISKTSDAPVNTIEVSGISQEMAYNGMVVIDTVNGSSGSSYPTGTLAQPANNLADALTIANGYNILNLLLTSSLTLDRPVIGYTITGTGRSNVDLNNQLITGSRWIECEITGIQNSHYSIYERCRILDLHNFGGVMIRCYFINETPITVQPFIPNMISDCRSGIAGNGSVVFDFSNGNIDFSQRAYSGGIRIINSTEASNVSTLEFIAGRFNFDNTTNSAGSFSVRGTIDCDGVEKPINPNVIISNSGALSRDGIADAIWEYER